MQEGGWETSIGVLCYYVVFGDTEGNLSKKVVERWVEKNPGSALARSIGELVERRGRGKFGEKVGKGLGLVTEEDSEGNQLW